MSRPRSAALAAVVAASLVVVASAPAQESVVARIVTPVSRAAAPGSTVTLDWTVTVVENGQTRPFRGGYVFVRLVGPDGARSPVAYGVHVRRSARYRARVTVPRGGIARVRIGVMGSSCSADGCRPAPRYFRIAGRVFR